MSVRRRGGSETEIHSEKQHGRSGGEKRARGGSPLESVNKRKTAAESSARVKQLK